MLNIVFRSFEEKDINHIFNDIEKSVFGINSILDGILDLKTVEDHGVTKLLLSIGGPYNIGDIDLVIEAQILPRNLYRFDKDPLENPRVNPNRLLSI